MSAENLGNVETLRRELRTVLGILERRKQWQPHSTSLALFAHARQLLGALRAAMTGTPERGEIESWEARLQHAQVTDALNVH